MGAPIVYFARCRDDTIKIGCTRFFQRRMKELRAEPLAAISCLGNEETEIHSRFSHLLVRGHEWFSSAPELMGFIAELKSLPIRSMMSASSRTRSPARIDKCENILERRFGRLVVVKKLPGLLTSKRRDRRWRCLCDCGLAVVETTTLLLSGRRTSCGHCPGKTS